MPIAGERLEQTASYAYLNRDCALMPYAMTYIALVTHRIGLSRELMWARAARGYVLAAFGAYRGVPRGGAHRGCQRTRAWGCLPHVLAAKLPDLTWFAQLSAPSKSMLPNNQSTT